MIKTGFGWLKILSFFVKDGLKQAMINNDSKKAMRIAMVGLSPADQVTFKGYLRVLLRLDVDLEWVAATHSVIELFVINDEFRHASSVAKLLQQNPNIPVLYVNRAKNGDGKLENNVLSLPLKQIQILYNWLITNVSVIKGVPTPIADTPTQPVQTQPTPTPVPPSTVEPTPPKADKPEVVRVLDPNFNEFIELIKTLHSRQDALFELSQDNDILAIINPAKQLLWKKNTIKPKASSAWRLKATTAMPESNHAVDMTQWLWESVWENSGDLVKLIDNTIGYQIRHWVKPPETSERRILLHIMTAMEKKPLTITQIANTTGVSLPTAQKAVISLLVADCLQESNYHSLKAYSVSTKPNTQEAPTSVVSAAPQTITPPPSEPVTEPTKPAEPAKEEKLGFLARLRRKLGL